MDVLGEWDPGLRGPSAMGPQSSSLGVGQRNHRLYDRCVDK